MMKNDIKKGNAFKCNEFRPITLMRQIKHPSKNFPQEKQSNRQFEFRNRLGNEQKSCDIRRNVIVCFVDFEKVLDRAQQDVLFEYMEITRIDNYVLRLLKQLYYNQTEYLKVDKENFNNNGTPTIPHYWLKI